MSIAAQPIEIEPAWEESPEPRPRITLEVLTPTGHEELFYLGPHAPRLTAKEIDLLHKVWLDFSDKLGNEELHHHDVVHFALNLLTRAMDDGQRDEVVEQLREHLREIQNSRQNGTLLTGFPDNAS